MCSAVLAIWNIEHVSKSVSEVAASVVLPAERSGRKRRKRSIVEDSDEEFMDSSVQGISFVSVLTVQ